MIIEVLSPSTTLHDRGRKLDHYRQLPALKEILLVASEERRAQHWRRQGARWVVDDLIGDADLRLATVPDPGRSTRAAACKLDVAPRHRYPRGSIARKAWTSARERDELRIQLPQPPG